MGSVTTKLRPGPGALLLISGLLVGCATAGGSPPKASPTVTSDGLVSTPSRLGVLFVKPGHNIGGYDQIFFSPMSISYKRGRKALGEEEEAEFLVALERGERERAEQAGIPVVSAPGACAMDMTFRIADLELTEHSSSGGSDTVFVRTMGAVTLVVEIRDSRSAEALLHFAQRRKLPGGRVSGVPHNVAKSRLKKTLDIMLADFGEQLLEVIPRSRTQLPVSPGCKGRFRAMGDAAAAR